NNIDKIGDTNDKKTRNFLVIIAKNEAIRIYNSKREIPDSEFVEESVEDSVDIEFEFDKKEYKKIIFDLIRTMDRKYSEPLLMKFFYNYTDLEIADFLGITVDNAKVRIHRGKNKLKEFLKESDFNGRI
ncbi:MAG: sigma-70 family RNA polymerase sigma factor, partial [Ruminococcus sp.]|nr:sigma-70 family RNA polymerase sigma factor [Ruminococcus sp.]